MGSVGIGTITNAGTRLNIADDAEAIRITGSQPYITFFTGGSYKGYLWKKGALEWE